MRKSLKYLFSFVFIVMSLLLVSCTNKKTEQVNYDEHFGISGDVKEGTVVPKGNVDEKTETGGATETQLPTESELPEIKEKYEILIVNGDVISGDKDMYDFYLLTKANNILTINITRKYDKDYYNSLHSQLGETVTSDVIKEYELSYDGKNYNYSYITSSGKETLASLEYLNYSKFDNTGTSALYSSRVSYVIANKPEYTAEELERVMLSSSILPSESADIINNTRSIVTFFYYNDLVFKDNRIAAINVEKNGEYKSYYSDYSILNTVVKVLNELDWVKDFSELGIEESTSTSHNQIMVNMFRTLYIDKKGLMLKQIDNNKEYLLYYIFNMDTGTVTMGYSALSSIINNIYAKLNDEQLEAIKGIINEELVYDITVGSYSYNYQGEREPWETNPIVISVDLLENQEAKIILKTVYYNYKIYVPMENVIATGTYEVIKSDTGNELLITDGSDYYRFKLTYKDNKSIYYMRGKSNPNVLFDKYCADEIVFYYGQKYFNGNLSQNKDNLFVMNTGSYSNQISDAMKELVKDFKPFGDYNDTLYNITPNGLEYVARIYKYEHSCATFIEFDGEILSMSEYFGGCGVTQFAYYHKDDTYLLYYIHSWGSGLHRSLVYAFDFKTKTISKVTDLEFPMIDIEFEATINNDNEFVLSVYHSKYQFNNENPFVIEKAREELLEENILGNELVYWEEERMWVN